MYNKYLRIGVFLMIGFLSGSAHAQHKAENKESNGAKELSGISIIGNKEAPKSLFIVPWKSSEVGVETSLSSRLLNEKLTPVDKEVFERELSFYYATEKKN
jgi:hypothetical protein